MIDSTWKEKGIKDRKKAEEYIRLYRYSSYPDYLGQDRIENIIINKDALPKYFETPNDFKTIVTECFDYQIKVEP